jgi:aspartyl-tRNA(Asn)/glutamyl-tRNA(Gln) amidotransferase subunit C
VIKTRQTSCREWQLAFCFANKEDKLPEPAATRLLTQLVSFASQNKEDKSSPRREGLGFCFAKQGGQILCSCRGSCICFANKEDYMANVIDDATIDYVGILAKLELSDEEKEQAKKDMASMLDYIDQLNELDTTGVEPMSHVFPIENVMREDVVTNGDESEKTLFNAPERKDKTFVVPKTVE